MSTLVDDLRAELAAANARAAAAESDRDAALSQTEALTRALRIAQERAEEAERVAGVLGDDATRLRDERDALRAVVEGRAEPPTDAEVRAHDHNMWLVVIRPQGCAAWSVLVRLIVSANPPFGVAHSATPVVIRGGLSYAPAGKWLPGLPKDALRWWPLDQDGRPAQWPVATEASR